MRSFLIGFLLLLTGLPAQAARVWTADSLPMVHLQDARRYVCNPDGVLSAAAVDSADLVLQKLERTRGVESVVVVVRRLAGGDCYTFGMELARKYGVGSKRQNSGLIIIVSTEDRGYYILTGRGLEGTLPDAICRRVENRVMVPALRAGEWDKAIVGTVTALARYIEGDHSLTPETDRPEGAAGMVGGLIVAGLFVLVFVLLMARNRKQTRCPQCKKGHMHITHQQRFLTPDGRRMLRLTRQCDRCGYVEIIDKDDPDDRHTGLLAGLPFLFLGGRGGGFGGGGGDIGGGSFGGGDFGGGGSGGRF